MTAAASRIPCIVPFCGRTAPRDRFPGKGIEIICAAHWRAVSAAAKAEKRRLTRIGRKAVLRGKAMPALCRRMDANWARCKAEAIEHAAGIA